jgi:hypothetical protein
MGKCGDAEVPVADEASLGARFAGIGRSCSTLSLWSVTLYLWTEGRATTQLNAAETAVSMLRSQFALFRTPENSSEKS